MNRNRVRGHRGRSRYPVTPGLFIQNRGEKMKDKTAVIGARYCTKEKAWYVTHNGDKFSKATFPSEQAAIEGYKEYVKVMKENFPREVK